MVDILLNFIDIDPKTAISILLTGNAALAIVILGYSISHGDNKIKNQLQSFGYSKVFQSIAWCIVFLINQFPVWLGGILGNDFLFIGMYMESVTMMSMVKKESGLPRKMLNILLVVLIVSYNVLVIMGSKPHIRVALASFGVFLILVFPTFLYILERQASTFKKSIGSIYIVFLCALPFRGVISLMTPNMNIFTNNLIQSVTFLSLILILIVGGTGFLLLFKEEADRELQTMATLDPLTGISNRRYFMKEAQRIFELHKRKGHQLTILFIDIDHFKNVNDQYGHNFGDDVLITMAKIIDNEIGESDLCCRYGGEEFIVLLSNMDANSAFILGESIRNTIKEIKFESNPDFCFTISGGLFTKIPLQNETLEQFIEHSDQAMYMAKTNGRNCIIPYV